MLGFLGTFSVNFEIPDSEIMVCTFMKKHQHKAY